MFYQITCPITIFSILVLVWLPRRGFLCREGQQNRCSCVRPSVSVTLFYHARSARNHQIFGKVIIGRILLQIWYTTLKYVTYEFVMIWFSGHKKSLRGHPCPAGVMLLKNLQIWSKINIKHFVLHVLKPLKNHMTINNIIAREMLKRKRRWNWRQKRGKNGISGSGLIVAENPPSLLNNRFAI